MEKPPAGREQAEVSDDPLATLVVEELLERGHELSEVTRLLERTASGEGSVLVLEGTAGIGKTRLLAQVRADATDHGMCVLPASEHLAGSTHSQSVILANGLPTTGM